MTFHWRMNLADAQQAALGFLIKQTSYIEPGVVKQQYPEVQYSKLIPVDSSANPWAKSITYYSSDQFGQAEFFEHLADDMPRADVTREKHETTVRMAGIGYGYTLEELGQAMMIPGTNLTNDRASAARRAYEEFVDDAALRGKTAANWSGIINYPGIQTAFAEDDGTNSSMAWDDKTTDMILRDINTVLSSIYTTTLTIEMADTLLLPIEAMLTLATRRIENTNNTLISFLSANNVYTVQTKQPLDIIGVRGLETAGVGGVGRMVAYRRDPDVLKMHIPMPHRFLPVWQTGPMRFDVPGIFRLGGLEIRRPKSVRYVDGIADAPYA
jgi:hypothetical protein